MIKYCIPLPQVSRAVWEEMVNACWCGLLAALSLLLDARYYVFESSTLYCSILRKKKTLK